MRRAEVHISIQGTDVSMDLRPHLLSLTYRDKADGELDDLQLVLEDRDGLWQGDWLPKIGDMIHAAITTYDWRALGESEELDCGEFEIDECELESSRNSGDVVTIKAIPAAVRSGIMKQRKTRAWNDCPFPNLVADIVGPSGLDTVYKAPLIVFQRVEQRQESDLAFLQRVATDQGLRVAIKDKRCIIYAGQTADALEPILIKRAEADFSSFRFKRTVDGVYTSCVVGYTDALDSETEEENFCPEEPPETGKVLTINKRIEHPAQAERLAKAELRDKNRKEMTASLDGMGDIRLRAGIVLRTEGWGAFDGNYVIDQATHTATRDGGYRTSVELDKALDY